MVVNNSHTTLTFRLTDEANSKTVSQNTQNNDIDVGAEKSKKEQFQNAVMEGPRAYQPFTLDPHSMYSHNLVAPARGDEIHDQSLSFEVFYQGTFLTSGIRTQRGGVLIVSPSDVATVTRHFNKTPRGTHVG